MNTAASIARFVLGLVLVVFGMDGFLNFMPMGPVPALAGQFAGALIQSH
jgi:putative oxidoreductase